MKKIILFLVTLSLILTSCSTVMITGRKQLNLIPTSTMLSMSFQQYDTFLKDHKISKETRKADMVNRVGKRLATAVEEYMAKKGMEDKIGNFDWEFKLIESEEVNAWCMPGGKIVVYTGILPLTQNEAGLAVVMAHEIAHAIANHGNERMSQGLMTQLGGMALSKAIEEKPEETKQLYMAAFGLGAQFGIMLPYSRLHEYEADELGLIFMTMAGYDPQQAVGFWQRMSKQGSGQKPPEFASTHPADDKRIANLKKLLPKMEKYKPGETSDRNEREKEDRQKDNDEKDSSKKDAGRDRSK
ncbi:MAG: M48 family metallopeptidase [Fidelibacterota bacterium]